MRVIGYVRVSTPDQAENGVSLDAQCERIRLFCGLYDHELAEIIVDAGESGKSMDRVGIQQVLRVLRAGAADGIVVMKLDRLTRSIADLQDLVQEFFVEGAPTPRRLFSVGEHLDTTTANGRMMVNLLMVIAQWERETIGERTKEALGYKKSIGQRVGSIPYGWELADDGFTLKSNQREQSAIVIAKELKREGLSLRAIGEKLMDMGYHQRNGSTWKPQTIKNLLGADVPDDAE
jgi:DNA invertase Pin-like site-specific DNA recombinase